MEERSIRNEKRKVEKRGNRKGGKKYEKGRTDLRENRKRQEGEIHEE